jgi:hypothetical protein
MIQNTPARVSLWLLGWLLIGSSLPVEATIRVAMPRPGNAYYPGEHIRLVVTASGESRLADYMVTDYWGQVRRQAKLRIGEGRPQLLELPRTLPLGLYTLRLSSRGQVVEDTFCLIPRPDEEPGDPGLFGLEPGANGEDEEGLRAAAQMGVRLVRLGLLWPNIGPRRDEWHPELVTRRYELAQRLGLQMMIVLGYTPGYQGEKPINYLDDWVRAASFIWHPREPNEFARYLNVVMGGAAGKTVSWPSPEVLPQEATYTPVTRPWVQSWEMWNEADMCFYVGDWNRYQDLLRLTYAFSRRATPEAAVIYGGSTGNFVAMGMVASGSARYCFDDIALHTGGAVETALKLWYAGAQQIPYVVGQPRETVHTECYGQGRAETVDYQVYRETPEELLRNYLTLKAWREKGYFRAGCLGGYIRFDDCWAPGTSLLVRRYGHLSPTPLYPAFAATRKLLSDATAVGPVDLGPDVWAHLFLKGGKPMIAAWSDEGRTVSFALDRGAYRVDVMGRRISLGNKLTWRRTLTAEPVVIVGARASSYLPPALMGRYRLIADTPYGTLGQNEACWVWYVKALKDDLSDWGGADLPLGLLSLVRTAANAQRTAPAQGPRQIGAVQAKCREAMGRVVARCASARDLHPRAAATLYRLARLEEWLGEVADARAVLWGSYRVSAGEVQALEARLGEVKRGLAGQHGEATAVFCEHLLRRAEQQVQRAVDSQGRGAWDTASHLLETVEALGRVERGVVLGVVPLVDFATSRPLRKSRLLEPASPHTLQVWVYNKLSRAVSGTLTVKMPEGWSPAMQTVAFQAAADSPSAPVTVTCQLPADPQPWTTLSSFTLDGAIRVELPESLADRPYIEISGVLDNGQVLATAMYQPNVGRWLDDPVSGQAGAPAVMTARAEEKVRQARARGERQRLGAGGGLPGERTVNPGAVGVGLAAGGDL